MENNIEVFGRVKKDYKQIAEIVANEALVLMKQPVGLEVAITFVSPREIRKLNREFRQVDKVTDVLSFPSTSTKPGEIFDISSAEAAMLKSTNDFIHFGDMALCTKKIKSQAKEYGNSFEDELKKLVIHSILHLMGYDHIKDSDYELMKKYEDSLSKKIKI